MPITHRLNHAALERLLRSPDGAVGRDVYRRSIRVQNRARQLVGVDTGRLRASVAVELVSRGGAPVGRIGSDVTYALVHHEGHGVIVPRRAKVLRFRPRGSPRWVFRPRVRAVAGNPFLRDALRAARG